MRNPQYAPSISLIIPAYKQERTILKDVKNLVAIMQDLPNKYEILIVIDGMVDKTHQKLKRLKADNVRVIEYEKNIGKGNAIKTGALEANGDIVGFIDAGMDINPEGITMLLNHMQWYDADIIIGSKLHPVSQVSYPFSRRILSWGYRNFTRTLFGFKVKDSQVGLKFYKRKVVQDVFPRLRVKKFAFDIEILAISYRLGYRKIYEAPVKLDFRGVSSINSINLWKVILSMLWDTVAVFYRVNIRRDYKRKLPRK